MARRLCAAALLAAFCLILSGCSDSTGGANKGAPPSQPRDRSNDPVIEGGGAQLPSGK